MILSHSDTLRRLRRVVVGVDPSGGHGEDHDEQGIIVGGLGWDDQGYVLADLTCKLTPDGWGRRAVNGYVEWQADFILGERNYGGEMVEFTVQTAAEHLGVMVRYKDTNSARGKTLRAEPVAALYEQGRISHLGVFPELETQMTEWDPYDKKAPSPDRIDALVFVFTELMVDPMPVVTQGEYKDTRLRRRR